MAVAESTATTQGGNSDEEGTVESKQKPSQ